MEVLDAVSANPGFRVNNAATLGTVLRGNGTNFVPAVLGSGDLNNADFIESISPTAGRITVSAGLNPTINIDPAWVGQNTITTLGTISGSAIWNATVIDETKGGTGQSGVNTGEILYGSALNIWSRLPAFATGNALLSGVTPSWGKIDLAAHTTGSLGIARGGTNASSFSTTGGLVYYDGTKLTNGADIYTTGLTRLVVVQDTISAAAAAYGLHVNHTATSTTAAISKRGIFVELTGIWSGGSSNSTCLWLYNNTTSCPANYGLYVDCLVGWGIYVNAGDVFLASARRLTWNSDADLYRLALGVVGVENVLSANTGFRVNNTAAIGALLKGNATNFVSFAPGAALQVLRVNAGGTDLEWAAPSGGGGVTSVSGVAGRILITGAASTPVINIDPAWSGGSQLTQLGTITAGTWTATVIDETRGGTGQSTVAIGSILYGSALNVWSPLLAFAAGNVLLSGATPSWGKVGLTTHVSGILAEANGGTGDSTYTSGQLLIGNGTGLTKNLLTAGTNVTIVNGVGTITISAAGGSTSFADPGNAIGLTEIVGVATTAMRSDAAPALSQGVVPTWTGAHTFTSLSGTNFRTLSADGAGPGLQMQKRGSSGGGSSAAVASGSAIGQINFLGWNGAAYARGSYITGLSLETFSGVANGGAVLIYTTPAGGTADAERVRITLGLSVGQAVTVSSGVINALTGYRINNAVALSGHFLRGNATNFVDSIIQVGDLPSHPHAAADITSGVIAIARLGSSGTPSATTFLNGLNAWATPAGGATFGNPTGIITLSTTNGVATTAMRSDASPALSPAISPTWSGTHTFTTRPKIQVNSDNLNPALIFERGAGGTQWGIHENNGFFYIRNITAAADRLELSNTVTAGFYLRANGTTFVASQLSANDLIVGTVPITRLGSSGTPSATTYLNGLNQWAVPPGGGGGGSPGGASGQIQFNQAGAFGGVPGVTYSTGTTILTLNPPSDLELNGSFTSISFDVFVASSGQIGFFSPSSLVGKQPVTGSKGGNAALASLLVALANFNLITNSTT